MKIATIWQNAMIFLLVTLMAILFAVMMVGFTLAFVSDCIKYAS